MCLCRVPQENCTWTDAIGGKACQESFAAHMLFGRRPPLTIGTFSVRKYPANSPVKLSRRSGTCSYDVEILPVFHGSVRVSSKLGKTCPPVA